MGDRLTGRKALSPDGELKRREADEKVSGIFHCLVGIHYHFFGGCPKHLALQERCAEGAKNFVERLNAPESYISHYSKKRDACFIRVGFYLGVIKDDVTIKDKSYVLKHPHWMVASYNVFDGKGIGNCAYIGMENQECWVENTKCKTIEEFENLIRPYMEE